MSHLEYKVVPAPTKAKRGRWMRSSAGRFAERLQQVFNEQAKDGWEYVRTDTLPCEQRQGLSQKVTTYQNLLVFRRLPEMQLRLPEQDPAPAMIQSPEHFEKNVIAPRPPETPLEGAVPKAPDFLSNEMGRYAPLVDPVPPMHRTAEVQTPEPAEREELSEEKFEEKLEEIAADIHEAEVDATIANSTAEAANVQAPTAAETHIPDLEIASKVVMPSAWFNGADGGEVDAEIVEELSPALVSRLKQVKSATGPS